MRPSPAPSESEADPIDALFLTLASGYGWGPDAVLALTVEQAVRYAESGGAGAGALRALAGMMGGGR